MKDINLATDTSRISLNPMQLEVLFFSISHIVWKQKFPRVFFLQPLSLQASGSGPSQFEEHTKVS